MTKQQADYFDSQRQISHGEHLRIIKELKTSKRISFFLAVAMLITLWKVWGLSALANDLKECREQKFALEQKIDQIDSLLNLRLNKQEFTLRSVIGQQINK